MGDLYHLDAFRPHPATIANDADNFCDVDPLDSIGADFAFHNLRADLGAVLRDSPLPLSQILEALGDELSDFLIERALSQQEARDMVDRAIPQIK